MADDDQQLLEFPCSPTLKVIGSDEDDFTEWVVAVVVEYMGSVDTQSVHTRPSRGGRYISVSVAVRADTRGQLDGLYRALSADERVAFLL